MSKKMRFISWWLGLGGMLSVLSCGAGDPSCEADAKGRAWESARKACSKEYFEELDPQVGLYLVQALVGLGKYPEAAPLAGLVAPELDTAYSHLIWADAAKRAEDFHRSEDAALGVLKRSAKERDVSMYARGMQAVAIALLSQERLTEAKIYLDASLWMFKLLADCPALQPNAAKRSPGDRASTHQQYADLLYKRRQLSEADGELRASMIVLEKADSDIREYYRIWYHLKLGVVRNAEKFWNGARPEFEESLRLISKQPGAHNDAKQSAHLNFAYLLRQSAKRKEKDGNQREADDLRSEALQHLREAQQSGADKADVHLQRGILLLDRKQYAAASDELHAALQVTNQEKLLQEIYYNLGKIKEEQEDIEGATFDYKASSQQVNALLEKAGEYSADIFALYSLPFFRRFGVHASRHEWDLALQIVIDLDWISKEPEEPMNGSSEPPLVEDLLKVWNGRRLLLFVSDERGLWRLDVRNQRVTGQYLGNAEQLEKLASSLEQNPSNTDVARQLGAALLPSADREGETFEIWAMRELGEMPWSALRRGNDLAIKSTPLARILTLRKFWSRGAPRSGSVVLGDFSADKSRLPAAEEEAKEIAARLKVNALIEADATRAAFLSAQNAEFLYLAGHAVPSELLTAYLPLADGSVTSREIRTRKLAPNVVVLSSCGGSDATDALGWNSLTGAFIEAGSRVVIASPRSVLDTAAREFSKHLDLKMIRTEPARALAEAQLAAAAAGMKVEDWSAFAVFLAAP